jgi:hypothetical protein
LWSTAWLAGFHRFGDAGGTLLGMPGFAFLYRYVLKPLGWVKPDICKTTLELHRFARGWAASLCLGARWRCWPVCPSWVGVGLAGHGAGALNLFAGFCAGCMVYYWLSLAERAGLLQISACRCAAWDAPESEFPMNNPEILVAFCVDTGYHWSVVYCCMSC